MRGKRLKKYITAFRRNRTLNRVQTKTPQGEAAGTVTYGFDYSGRMLQALDGSSSTPYQIGYDMCLAKIPSVR